MNPPLLTSAPEGSPALALSELENEVIAFFVDLVRSFGAPKSLGAIYGLLFVSEEPLSFEQIANRLQMSNGSVSQGLRLMKDLGAVQTTFVAGDRRDFYVAETRLRQLVTGVLRQRVERQLLNGEGRLSQLFTQAGLDDQTTPTNLRPSVAERLKVLRRWQTQARDTLPVVLKMLEG